MYEASTYLCVSSSECRHFVLDQANLRSKFFSDDEFDGTLRQLFSDNAPKGNFCAGIPVPAARSLEQRETRLTGEDRDCFLRFMRKMLKWEPELRDSAKELAEDEWILKHGVNTDELPRTPPS